jgi:hypothetical protein
MTVLRVPVGKSLDISVAAPVPRGSCSGLLGGLSGE